MEVDKGGRCGESGTETRWGGGEACGQETEGVRGPTEQRNGGKLEDMGKEPSTGIARTKSERGVKAGEPS